MFIEVILTFSVVFALILVADWRIRQTKYKNSPIARELARYRESLKDGLRFLKVLIFVFLPLMLLYGIVMFFIHRN